MGDKRLSKAGEHISDLFWIGIAWVALTVADTLQARFPRRACQLCHATAERLSTLTSLRARRWHAFLLVREAILLGESGDKQRSLEVNDRVLQQHGASSDPETLVQVAWASNNKAVDLTALGRMSEALVTYQALTERFPPEPRFVPVLAKAWMNWAVDLLDELGMHDEEKALYDRIQALLIDNRDRSLDEYLAWAFVNKGIQLDEEHQYEKAIELFDVVIRRWWASMSVETSMSMHEALAAAGRHRCRALTFLKRYDKVIKGAQPVVERYYRTRDVGIDEQVAWTLLNQAFAERQLGLVADARRTDGLLLKRYAASPSEEARLVADNCRRLALSDPIGPAKPPDSG